jgi:uncharacterized protein
LPDLIIRITFQTYFALNKRKIFNDPVYGFVYIPYEIIFDIIEHPYFQRLRRIQQLGLTNYVYPGALHTRFHHALGTLHLTSEAIDVLRSKGTEITEEESKAVCIAILLHDIGHGPFSHTLENSMVQVSHEQLSLFIMQKLNLEFGGRLDLAIRIFTDQYEKRFLHQLISSQLDMDRMDYLNRDSYFTGVHEGVISYDRIIKMLAVHHGKLVVEAKGIYSIEKFIIARRLMYWQVYLHKTVLSAEEMLLKILQRAKYLGVNGHSLFASGPLKLFLENNITEKEFYNNGKYFSAFMLLDDYDLFNAIKSWMNAEDKLLSYLCKRLINRNLFKVSMQDNPFPMEKINAYRKKAKKMFGFTDDETLSVVFTDSTFNNAYSKDLEPIDILYKNGKTIDLAEASDQLNISVLSQPVVKYYLCLPKEILD